MIYMMHEVWKRETDYQLAKIIMRSFADEGILTASELDTGLELIMHEIMPPISGLKPSAKRPETLDNTGF